MRSWGQVLSPPSIRKWADVCGPGEAWEVAQSGRARTPATTPLICLAGPDDCTNMASRRNPRRRRRRGRTGDAHPGWLARAERRPGVWSSLRLGLRISSSFVGDRDAASCCSSSNSSSRARRGWWGFVGGKCREHGVREMGWHPFGNKVEIGTKIEVLALP